MENVTTINRSQITVKRGEIYYADLGVGMGSEQSGERPIFIVQNDIGNTYSPTVIAYAITSQLTKAKLPTHVEVGEECNLKPSIMLCEQVRTIDKKRLKGFVCKAPQHIIDKVDKSTEISLATGEGKLFSMSREEKLAYQKAKLVISIDSALRELIQEKESMSIIQKYMAKRENRIKELETYCKLNGLDYTRFYYIETQQQSRQYK